ncbi:hypothetical protein PG994_007009 [Apiospora phragmitis]|uniref:Uncharacterized protein n=1 Tax=Apiospora phragmitis TaxID=2905665 RepID=A0ABR1V249_9PEZI
MELDTVGGLVTALVSTYDAGFECYTIWQRKKWQANHYQGHARGRVSDGGSCGLSTSLMTSGSRVRQVYDSGVDVLGDAFFTGDSKKEITHPHLFLNISLPGYLANCHMKTEQCRGALQASLELLQAHVEALHSATTRRDNAPLGLFEMIRASETVRIACLRALAEQYQRAAVGRLVPRELPIRPPPSRRPSSAVSASVEAETGRDLSPELSVYGRGAEGSIGRGTGRGGGGRQGEEDEEDEGSDGGEGNGEDDCVNSRAPRQIARSSKSPFQSEPPSPPPTPKKMIPDDLQSTCTSEFGPRPRASVFCPEAVKYQVDLQKSMPSASSASTRHRNKNACCKRCGYREL